MKMMKTALLSMAALALCASVALADTKLTVGVGHMCCGHCKANATEGISKVAGDINIDGNTITMTAKGDDIVPVLNALRKSGFPANKINAGNAPVTIAVGHLCCGKCVNGLKEALNAAKLEDADMDSLKIEDGKMVIKAKEGKSLDLFPVLLAMEKGGFSADKIMLSGAAVVAKAKPATNRVVAHR
ncbi:MAG TPA: hypothetical protein VKU00_00850 [Chthonomonadaceae bacterium]|nr:hypothetical protein [Chthonomonadaceae bacterium]